MTWGMVRKTVRGVIIKSIVQCYLINLFSKLLGVVFEPTPTQ